jgi:hypothetical protein
MKLLAALTLVAASLLAYPQTKEATGDISGIVTDATGTAIAGATVYAVQQDSGLNDAVPRSAKTDRNGVFDFRGGMPLGSYKLYSRKDEDAYMSPLDKFYADPNVEWPDVQLTAAHPAATATVKLERQAGVLAGRILDAKTGEGIRALLSFVDGEGNGHGVSVDGDYRILLPPGKSVTLVVTAIGTRSDHAQIPVAPVRLEPGQYVYMDIPIVKQ